LRKRKSKRRQNLSSKAPERTRSLVTLQKLPLPKDKKNAIWGKKKKSRQQRDLIDFNTHPRQVGTGVINRSRKRVQKHPTQKKEKKLTHHLHKYQNASADIPEKKRDQTLSRGIGGSAVTSKPERQRKLRSLQA